MNGQQRRAQGDGRTAEIRDLHRRPAMVEHGDQMGAAQAIGQAIENGARQCPRQHDRARIEPGKGGIANDFQLPRGAVEPGFDDRRLVCGIKIDFGDGGNIAPACAQPWARGPCIPFPLTPSWTRLYLLLHLLLVWVSIGLAHM